MVPPLLLLAALDVSALEIKPHPIMSEQRLELTRQYCKKAYGVDSAELKDPQVIVIHATGINESGTSISSLEPATLVPPQTGPSNPGPPPPSEVNRGLHYIVDKNGDVYSLLPMNIAGRHEPGLDHVAIGIANVGMADKLTDAQVSADAELIKFIVQTRPSLHYLVGHAEAGYKNLSHFKLYKPIAGASAADAKSAPDAKFMRSLRAKVAATGLKLGD